jgi:hypothetical protein
MSELPQRRKSQEEIAQLRESMGVPVNPPAATEIETPPAILVIPEPLPTSAPRQVRSLKKSEHLAVTPAVIAEPHPVVAKAPASPKPVRSLRKSERIAPSPKAPTISPHSNLPGYRHSDRELKEIRRQAAIQAQMHTSPPKPLRAHPFLYAPGYLLALAGGICIYQDFRYFIPLSCALAAAALASFVFFQRPHSRHHAAFISIGALFLIVFGALYYFPQLRHAS